MVVVVLIVLLFALVVVAIVSPWRWGRAGAAGETDGRLQALASEVLGLEATRDAKYREIRDAELDRETGHLSDQDFRSVDTALRADAVEVLKRLDRAKARLEKARSAEVEDLERAADARTGRESAELEGSAATAGGDESAGRAGGE